MEIRCENCETKFDLNESLLNPEGTKVRCSICRHVFKAYPPETEAMRKPEPEEAEAGETAEAKTGAEPIAESASEAGQESTAAEKAKEIPLGQGFSQVRDAPAQAEPAGGDDLEHLLADAKRGLEEEETAPDEKGIETEPAKEKGARPSVRTELGETGPEVAAVMEGERTDSVERSGRSRLWVALLIVFVVLAGAVAGLYYFKPAEKEKGVDPGVRRLSFESVSSSFVASKGAGLLFVIRGMVKNNYPQSRNHLRVKASVLDDQGRVVKEKMAYAGNSYTEEEIKLLPLEEITKAMENRNGMTDQNVNLAPGESIPFMVVFDNFPDNLSEFTVEAVSSSPEIR